MIICYQVQVEGGAAGQLISIQLQAILNQLDHQITNSTTRKRKRSEPDEGIASGPSSTSTNSSTRDNAGLNESINCKFLSKEKFESDKNEEESCNDLVEDLKIENVYSNFVDHTADDVSINIPEHEEKNELIGSKKKRRRGTPEITVLSTSTSKLSAVKKAKVLSTVSSVDCWLNKQKDSKQSDTTVIGKPSIKDENLDIFNLSLVDLLKCSKCQEFFHQPAGYAAHMRREHNQTCPEGSCSLTFASKPDMARHVKLSHKKINVDSLLTFCQHCDNYVAKKSFQRGHSSRSKHTVECSYCPNRFTTKRDLLQHLAVRHLLPQ